MRLYNDSHSQLVYLCAGISSSTPTVVHISGGSDGTPDKGYTHTGKTEVKTKPQTESARKEGHIAGIIIGILICIVLVAIVVRHILGF